MAIDFTPAFVFSVLTKELDTGELQPLDADFYEKAEENVNKQQESKEQNSKQNNMNLEKMVAKLKEKRNQKILLYLAYEKPLPRPMPKSEDKLYDKIQKLMNDAGFAHHTSKIKITAEIPEIVTPRGSHIGPYKVGDIIETEDSNEEDFIISSKIGEKM